MDNEILCDYCCSDVDIALCKHCFEAQICEICNYECIECQLVFCASCICPNYKITSMFNWIDSCSGHLKHKVAERIKRGIQYVPRQAIIVKMYPARLFPRALLSYKPLNVYTVLTPKFF